MQRLHRVLPLCENFSIDLRGVAVGNWFVVEDLIGAVAAALSPPPIVRQRSDDTQDNNHNNYNDNEQVPPEVVLVFILFVFRGLRRLLQSDRSFASGRQKSDLRGITVMFTCNILESLVPVSSTVKKYTTRL